MGILDKLKISKSKTQKPKAKKPEKKQETEVKEEAVLTPDGKLTNVAKKVESKDKKAKPKKEDTGNAYRELIKPLVTEKGSLLAANNEYIFEVAPSSNKIEVRKAMKKVYGVDPIKVNMINMAGKEVRYGRTQGRTKNWKKAIITLPQGQKIDIQEGL